MGYYLLFPAYNEEKNIKEVLRDALRFFPRRRIIVVDDGSTDNTSKIVKKMKVFLISHKKNKGKAEAIKTGIKHLFKKKEFKGLAICDSDGQYKVKDAIKLLEVIKEGKADFVMGFRLWKEIPFRHRIGNFVWRKAFNILFGVNFKDTNCGLVAMNKKACKIIIKKIYGGYILENSMLIAALENGLKIEQARVNVSYKRKSGFKRGIRVVLGVLFFIVKEGVKHKLNEFKL